MNTYTLYCKYKTEWSKMHTARNDEIWTCEVVTFDLDTVSGIYVHKME